MVIFPVPGGGHFWGKAFLSSVECMVDICDVPVMNGPAWREVVPGLKTVEITATLTGEPIIQDQRPILLADASILELLSVVNKKFNERNI